MDLETCVGTHCNVKNERKQILIFDNGESDTEMKEENVENISSNQAESTPINAHQRLGSGS